jgi:transcriptional regulator with PAS, ATPase and Fis domain
MTALVDYATQVGSADAKVLIAGESGVGKGLLAQHIHRSSARADQPFVAVSCAAINDTLLESELFGHARGAFTGAYRDKAGQLRRAHGGTLFLDEVAEMSPRMQALLLRFLENGEIQPIGCDGPGARVDVRVVAATNRDLDERVVRGQFRADLLYRLRVIHLVVPPLRERPDDIDLLVRHFLGLGPRRLSISDEAMRLLHGYRWPGNVRELRNIIERLSVQTTVDVILPEHLPEHLQGANPAPGGSARAPAPRCRRDLRRARRRHALVLG